MRRRTRPPFVKPQRVLPCGMLPSRAKPLSEPCPPPYAEISGSPAHADRHCNPCPHDEFGLLAARVCCILRWSSGQTGASSYAAWSETRSRVKSELRSIPVTRSLERLSKKVEWTVRIGSIAILSACPPPQKSRYKSCSDETHYHPDTPWDRLMNDVLDTERLIPNFREHIHACPLN